MVMIVKEEQALAEKQTAWYRKKINFNGMAGRDLRERIHLINSRSLTLISARSRIDNNQRTIYQSFGWNPCSMPKGDR